MYSEIARAPKALCGRILRAVFFKALDRLAACAPQVEEASKVERGNMAAFTKLLELDPEADSEDALFTTES